MARKTKYDPETFPQVAEAWARRGLNDEQIAYNLGIGKTAFYEYQNRYPEFAEAVKRGKLPANLVMENAFFKKGKGFEYTERTVESVQKDGSVEIRNIKTTTKYFPPDTAAAFIWLKNREPDLWKDKLDVDTGVRVELNKAPWLEEALQNRKENKGD